MRVWPKAELHGQFRVIPYNNLFYFLFQPLDALVNRADTAIYLSYDVPQC